MGDSLDASFAVVDLYPLALLEGEGMGTAYEYSAKLKVLQQVMAVIDPLQRLFVGGLPEDYGLDLDLALLATRYGCQTVVADDRMALLEAFALALKSPPLAGWVDPDRFEMRHLDTLARPTRSGDVPFQLWVTTSAIQRLDDSELAEYLAQVRATSRYSVLLVPNKDNKEHLSISGLDGFFLTDLVAACRQAGLTVRQAGHLDVAPFPPGLQRSAEAKKRAASSPVERFVMHGLEWWARSERFMPRFVKRRFGHIAYVFLQS
jgi:hypothetical protein